MLKKLPQNTPGFAEENTINIVKEFAPVVNVLFARANPPVAVLGANRMLPLE